MKTYVVCTSPFGKSIPNYFRELINSFVGNGIRVIVIFDGLQKDLNSSRKIIFKTWPSKRPTKLRDFIFFYNICRKYSPTLVIGQFGSTNITLIVSKLLGIPNRIIYWHTMFLQLKTDSTKPKVNSYIRHYIKKILLRKCATLVMTNSSATKRDLFSHYKLSNIKVFNYLIPDIINDNKILKKEERDFAISFVARIDKSKGQELIIDEIPHVLKLYPSLRFYFIGDGSEKKRLVAKCKLLKISKNVIFTGNVDLNTVYQYMSKSLIHISASVEEAFGLVNAEAISVGTPILANKVGGITDILEEGKNGYFIDLSNKGDLRLKIQKILEKDWDSLSKNSRHIFLKRFVASKDNVKNQINKLEKELH